MSAPLSRPAAHVQLQLLVVLWGFTAILGRAISISAVPLVWYRLLFVVVALIIYVRARGLALRIPRAAALRYLGVGAIIGVHWLCFYGSIKEAGVATAVLALSTIAFFTSLVEPLVFRRRIVVAELVIGAIVVAGASLLIQYELKADPFGLVLGLVAAILGATFGVINGKLASNGEPPARLILYEMIGALVIVTLIAIPPGWFVAPSALSTRDIALLVVLAIACTVVPQIWIMHLLRVLSPFTVAVSVNLEPIYALVLAALVFPASEAPSVQFYVGAGVLFALVILNALRRTRPIA